MHEKILEWFDNIGDEALQSTCYFLRSTILNRNPEIIESYKWNIPFYTYKGYLCYLNIHKKVPYIGWMHGFHLEDPDHQWAPVDTKLIRKQFFPCDQDIPIDILHQYIDRALSYNDNHPSAKISLKLK